MEQHSDASYELLKRSACEKRVQSMGSGILRNRCVRRWKTVGELKCGMLSTLCHMVTDRVIHLLCWLLLHVLSKVIFYHILNTDCALVLYDGCRWTWIV